MPILWRVRPFVCLLLAVSTATGAAVPARACGCTTSARTPLVARETAIEPSISPVPAPQPCCNWSCCAVNRNAVASECCCAVPARLDEPRPDAPERGGGDARPARCDCDAPDVPPAPAAPAPAVHDSDDHATASPVPPVLIPGASAATERRARSTSTRPPTDLVVSLSRLTC